MLKEYLDIKSAKKFMNKINPLLPTGVECILICKPNERNSLKIQNKFGAIKELGSPENDVNMQELFKIIYETCKHFYVSFSFSRHGLEYVYVSIDVK